MRFREVSVAAVLGFLSLALLAQGASSGLASENDPLARASTPNLRLQSSMMLAVVRAGDRLVAVGERGLIQFSDDNGRRWTQVQSPVSVTLTSVRFATVSKGWAVGHGGVVLATLDGGASWNKQLDGVQAATLVELAARSLEGQAKEAVLQEASRLMQEGPDKPLFDVYFEDENTGMTVGAFGLAFATDDGGKNWRYVGNRLHNDQGSHIFRIHAGSAGLWLVGERGLLLRAPSIGQDFRREKLPYGGSLYGAACARDGVCYVYGLRGNVLQLANGSNEWSMVANDQQATITASTFGGDGIGSPYFADQAGRILAVDAKSMRLLPKGNRPLPLINSLASTSDGAIVAATVNGMVRVEPGEFRE